MAFKADIRKAVTANTRYNAIKVWKPDVAEYMDGSFVMRIEVTCTKKKRKQFKTS